jgi:hypothetical protein
MAEAVGLAASIIAVVEICRHIVTLAKNYLNAVQDAPQALQAVLTETSALKNVFESLDCTDSSQSLPPYIQKLGGPNGPIEGCRRCGAELEKLIDAGVPVTAARGKRRKVQETITSLAWPLKESKARKLCDELLQYKNTIVLELSLESA